MSDRLLKQAVDIQKTQQLSPLPQVDDVPKLTLKSNKVYTFQRSERRGVIYAHQSSQSTPLIFTLKDVKNWQEFAGIFDEYKIVQVTVKFVPTAVLNNSDVVSPLCTTVEVEDPTFDVSYDDMREYETYRVHPAAVYAERTLSPVHLVSSYSVKTDNGVSTQVPGKSVSNSWCRTADSTIEWLGLRWGLGASSDITTRMYNIQVDYILSFRSSK
jgi:hypothetical protein